MVRGIGSVEGNSPFSDNDWEKINSGGDSAIDRWIDDQMSGKSCVVVLVGSKTATRRWVRHEIETGWNRGLGVVGIRIHGLKDANKRTSYRGDNPFDCLTFEDSSKKLSEVVKCYDPHGNYSNERYRWISENLINMVEEAIAIRNSW